DLRHGDRDVADLGVVEPVPDLLAMLFAQREQQHGDSLGTAKLPVQRIWFGMDGGGKRHGSPHAADSQERTIETASFGLSSMIVPTLRMVSAWSAPVWRARSICNAVSLATSSEKLGVRPWVVT